MHQPLHEDSRLGIDIGRLVDGAADEIGAADTSFLSGTDDAALRTPPVEGAFETIALLTARLEGQVWLVSTNPKSPRSGMLPRKAGIGHIAPRTTTARYFRWKEDERCLET